MRYKKKKIRKKVIMAVNQPPKAGSEAEKSRCHGDPFFGAKSRMGVGTLGFTVASGPPWVQIAYETHVLKVGRVV